VVAVLTVPAGVDARDVVLEVVDTAVKACVDDSDLDALVSSDHIPGGGCVGLF
jgi:hypothetical protein